MSIFFLAFVLLTFSLEFLPLSHVQFLSVRSYLSETLSLLHKSISDFIARCDLILFGKLPDSSVGACCIDTCTFRTTLSPIFGS